MEDAQIQIRGAWRLMTGRADGMRMLDISADGFWNSFHAIVLALPALALSWLAITADLPLEPTFGVRIAIILRLAIADIGAWVLPLVGLALVVRPIGLTDRFSPYVVATNWGSAIIVWLMAPAALLRMVLPAAQEAASLISFLLFGASLVLTWRLTNASVARGPAVGTGVFIAMFVASLIALFSLQGLLGLSDIMAGN